MAAILLLLAGLVLLIVGAELLVRGASRLALAIGVSPLIIGLTVVAFGTSSPELSVSVIASLQGRGDLALGNVIGSNIFNILLVLGVSALIMPLRVSFQLVRFDVPLMVAASVVVLLMALDGSIGRADGGLLVAGVVAYSTILIRQGRRESADFAAAQGPHGTPGLVSRVTGWTAALLVLIGLALLVMGAKFLVNGAVVIARLLGVSELVIGLTVVACGTSLPEVATSIMATIRGERDIAVGNIVGSNIFNILAILGAAAVVGGIDVAPAALRFDIPIMIIVAVACMPVFFSGASIDRWEGLLFVLFYAAYIFYLFLASTSHDALPFFSRAVFGIAAPLTLLAFIVMSWRWWRRSRPES